MDAASQPPADQTAPPPSPVKGKKARSRWRMRLLLLGLALIPVLLLAARPAYRTGKIWYARYQAEQCLKYIEEANWQDAMRALFDATRHGRDEPAVMRATATFLTKTSNEPRGLIMILKRLADSGHALPEDHFALGQAHISLGELDEARRIHAALSAQLKDSKEGLELLAQIQRAEGRPIEAEATLRRALLKAPNDPDSKLRLALLDYSNTFPEVQTRGRQIMWEVAQARHQAAVAAIKVLAQDGNLTAPEAERLFEVVEEHPHATPALRLEVLSAVIRLSPHRRDEVFTAEVARHQGKNLSEMTELLTWLAREKQYARILRLVPIEEAVKTKEAFTYVVQALGEEGRWADLRRLLTGGGPVPVTRARVLVWLAQAAVHLEPKDADAPREHLESAFEHAVKTDDFSSIAAASQLAESRGLYDLAYRCYEKLAKASPKVELEMMEKVREMALRLRDTQRLMEASQKLLDLRPGNGAFRDQVAYLRLLSGAGMELAEHDFDQTGSGSVSTGVESARVPPAFLRALSAYRFKDQGALQAELDQADDDAGRLSPGQRAVLSGLLALTGMTLDAFRLAETVNETILLPEERAIFTAARR